MKMDVKTINRLLHSRLWLRMGFRGLLFLLLALLCVPSASAQGRGRPWSRGLLDADEFGSMPASVGGRELSHLEYDLSYALGGHDDGAHTYIYCRSSALMYPTASWMLDGHRTDAEVAYNQALFDLVEIHSRHLQRQALLMKKRSQFDQLLAGERLQLDREVALLQAATDYGRDSLTLERIRQKNRQWLNDHPTRRPVFAPKRYWWMIGMEAGIDLSTGFITQTVTPSIGSSGFVGGIGWNRHGLYLRVVTADVVSRDSMMTYDGTMGLEPLIRVDASLLSYGYTVLDRASYSITPYVAYGVTDLTWYVGDCFTLGVMGFWHFHHWHSIKDGARGKARCFTPSAMANLFVSYANFGDGSSGLTFGAHLGITFKIRRESVKMDDSAL